jgi:outer membrane protein assembly factor BamB
MADDIMYMATGPRVEQVGPYDINKREFLWFLPYHEINATWYSFCAIRGDLLYFGTADIYYGTALGFYAINRHTGKIVWEQHFDGVFEKWRRYDGWTGFELEYYHFLRNVDLLDFMAPTVWRDLVIFTGGDTKVRAFDTGTGELRWERTFDTPIASAPTIASGRVYFGIMGDYENKPQLICLSARDGSLLWQMETDGSILSAPVIAGKRIIFGTDESVFYVLEQVF